MVGPGKLGMTLGF